METIGPRGKNPEPEVQFTGGFYFPSARRVEVFLSRHGLGFGQGASPAAEQIDEYKRLVIPILASRLGTDVIHFFKIGDPNCKLLLYIMLCFVLRPEKPSSNLPGTSRIFLQNLPLPYR